MLYSLKISLLNPDQLIIRVIKAPYPLPLTPLRVLMNKPQAFPSPYYT